MHAAPVLSHCSALLALFAASVPVRCDEIPVCNCACCVAETRGTGVRWGRTADDPSQHACVPWFYGQTAHHVGFVTCPVIGESFCAKQPHDPILGYALADQVDTAAFCMYECTLSQADGPTTQVARGGECVPIPPFDLLPADWWVRDDGLSVPAPAPAPALATVPAPALAPSAGYSLASAGTHPVVLSGDRPKGLPLLLHRRAQPLYPFPPLMAPA